MKGGKTCLRGMPIVLIRAPSKLLVSKRRYAQRLRRIGRYRSVERIVALVAWARRVENDASRLLSDVP
jgi:hypothetical protein